MPHQRLDAQAINDCWNRSASAAAVLPELERARPLPQLPGLFGGRGALLDRELPPDYARRLDERIAPRCERPSVDTDSPSSCSASARNGSRLPTPSSTRSRSRARSIRCRIGAAASCSASSICAANCWSASRSATARLDSRRAASPTRHSACAARLLVLGATSGRVVCPGRRGARHPSLSPARAEIACRRRRQGRRRPTPRRCCPGRAAGRLPRRGAAVPHARPEPGMSARDLSQLSMLDLFRLEARGADPGADGRPAGARARPGRGRPARSLHARRPLAQGRGAHRRISTPACRWRMRWRTASSPRSSGALMLTRRRSTRFCEGVDLLIAIANASSNRGRGLGRRAGIARVERPGSSRLAGSLARGTRWPGRRRCRRHRSESPCHRVRAASAR